MGEFGEDFDGSRGFFFSMFVLYMFVRMGGEMGKSFGAIKNRDRVFFF